MGVQESGAAGAARALTLVDGCDWRAVASALSARLDGDGPALFLTAEPPGGGIPETVPASTAAVIETSGSTGHPKRVMLSETALRASADATANALGGAGQWLLCLPAHYVAGLQVLVRSHVAGLPTEWVDPGFDADGFVAASARLTAERRYVALVPTQLARLVDAGERSAAVRETVARLDALLVGGQAVPATVASRSRALGYAVVRSYGSSETATGCIYDGYPVGATRTRLVDGVLEIASPALADGYLGDPALTDAVFHTEDGVRWYRTGDRARIHPDGRVEVLGRADNVIVSGGINVSLDRVEALVRELVPDAVVVGVDSEKWGQVPVVVTAVGATVPHTAVGTADPHTADLLADLLAELRRLAREQIGVAAQPDRIVLLPELPRLASGKPDRRAIAQLVASAPAAP